MLPNLRFGDDLTMSLFDQDDPDAVRHGDAEATVPPPSPPVGPSPAEREGKRRRFRRGSRRAPAEEYIIVKREHGPWRKATTILLVFAIVIGALVGGSYWWYRRQVDPPGSPGRSVSVVIKQGTSTDGIAHALENAGVISNHTVFTFYVRRKDAGPFEAGRFVLHKNSDFNSVINVLERGPLPPQITRVNIPEGLTLAQITAKLNRGIPRFTPTDIKAALAGGQVRSSLRQGPKGSWEGLLYPASYDVGLRTGVATVLSQMASEMDSVAREEDIANASATVARKYSIRLTPYQAMIVASLIQREAGNAQEAPKIATVIYNRLHQNIALGIDATSLYLANLTGKEIDFKSPSAYNTRRQKGLPPTPIAAPSRASIHAALHPADGPWIYYVLTSRRSHTFAVTNAQFEQAKQLCKARGLGCG